jgi:hypothetical protein
MIMMFMMTNEKVMMNITMLAVHKVATMMIKMMMM